jgi:hypothetical protein
MFRQAVRVDCIQIEASCWRRPASTFGHGAGLIVAALRWLRSCDGQVLVDQWMLAFASMTC